MESGEYDWHTDVTKNKECDIKLTCLLNLSEETYEGGEFHTMGNRNPNESIKFTSGMGLVFNPLIALLVSDLHDPLKFKFPFCVAVKINSNSFNSP